MIERNFAQTIQNGLSRLLNPGMVSLGTHQIENSPRVEMPGLNEPQKNALESFGLFVPSNTNFFYPLAALKTKCSQILERDQKPHLIVDIDGSTYNSRKKVFEVTEKFVLEQLNNGHHDDPVLSTSPFLHPGVYSAMLLFPSIGGCWDIYELLGLMYGGKDKIPPQLIVAGNEYFDRVFFDTSNWNFESRIITTIQLIDDLRKYCNEELCVIYISLRGFKDNEIVNGKTTTQIMLESIGAFKPESDRLLMQDGLGSRINGTNRLKEKSKAELFAQANINPSEIAGIIDNCWNQLNNFYQMLGSDPVHVFVTGDPTPRTSPLTNPETYYILPHKRLMVLPLYLQHMFLEGWRRRNNGEVEVFPAKILADPLSQRIVADFLFNNASLSNTPI